MPDLRVPLCTACHARTWQRTARLLALALLNLLSGTAAARLIFLVWPWVPWPLFVLASGVGALLAWSMGSMLIRRLSGEAFDRDVWQGAPARVVSMDSDGWTLHVTSASLVSSLESVAADSPNARSVVENDVVVPGLGAVAATVVAATALWFAWHPTVRVVNVTGSAMEVRVDGRSVALMAGVPGEAPSAGTEVRVPEGSRVFEARRLDGEVEDETTGWVTQEGALLYAPGSQGRCFRVEQRAYGRAPQPKPEVLLLQPDRRFHRIPYAIDAWFQPNPPTEPNFWFSGGVRRAVRLGDCPTEDSVPSHEP